MNNLMRRIREWYSMRTLLRTKKNCDHCGGRFRLGQLTPTSGDWYLCPECTTKLFEQMKNDRSANA